MPSINPQKIVVFTGAGVSAESGLKTFRDNDGLWNNYRVEDVATPEAFARDPGLVLEFYNQRRAQARNAQPNAAHEAIARLEEKYEVVVITQNVDDLHERAGSTNVLHLHGLLTEARSTADPSLIYERGLADLNLGDLCEKGSQLRPNIVWFGEMVINIEPAAREFVDAGKVLVVGTSLQVYPAAGLLKKAHFHSEKYLVTLEVDYPPRHFKWMRGKAASVVPSLAKNWLQA
ncbi:Sir2 family NAD-dependent protein deacetylase [Cerasicoccus maritimus]|uniref:Sir2 family NAD-dependent protein deacetylase n=1 Tax=Cerasicoccus maritimus TaxID=490089 RepID=UPI002852CEAE|nr:Sir2 family NAD-dependent protein deacetylase [Cerasicoccus maritimus]